MMLLKINPLKISLLWYEPSVCPLVLVGLNLVGIPPLGVRVCEVIGVLLDPMYFHENNYDLAYCGVI